MTGRLAEAHAALTAALEGFSPTPEMPEIAEAQALLGALAETEEVKVAEAQRQRRLHLQTAYGQAMMWAKGFSAEETRAAFSRATEFAGLAEIGGLVGGQGEFAPSDTGLQDLTRVLRFFQEAQFKVSRRAQFASHEG
jgi:hypothetical protein